MALASVLVNPADLLILDEPTNHIDDDMVAVAGTVSCNPIRAQLLMVTHDRYFLDRVATGIIEIDKGRFYSYTGNYSNVSRS